MTDPRAAQILDNLMVATFFPGQTTDEQRHQAIEESITYLMQAGREGTYNGNVQLWLRMSDAGLIV